MVSTTWIGSLIGCAGAVEFLVIEGAGHDLGFGRRVHTGMQDVPDRIVRAFLAATTS